MKYFTTCKDLTELKTLYRSLCMQHHPDKGGDVETMKSINLEYEKAIKYLAANEGKEKGYTTEQVDAEILNAEEYKEALNAVINLEGIEIELCGSWIWITGNTYPHKSIFKSAKFQWAPVKKQWYFRSVEHATSNFKPLSMDQIRAKHGSQTINNSKQYSKFLAA